jgi:formylmethanofuran dehydrogenase subunit E-like metal-binding protein
MNVRGGSIQRLVVKLGDLSFVVLLLAIIWLYGLYYKIL